MEWDVRSFANEGAHDWLRELLKSVSGDLVKQALHDVDTADSFIDSQDAERAVAAAEVVAASRGFPSDDLPDEATLWIKAKRYQAPDAIVSKAIAVIDKILKRSELKDVWEDTEAGPQWRKILVDLTRRLEEGEHNPIEPRESDLEVGDAEPQTVHDVFDDAIHFVSEGDHESAIKKFDRAIEMEPGFVVGFIGRGTSFLALGLFEDALNDLNRAIDLEPELSDAYYLRAQAYFQTSHIGRAIADLTILINMQPERGEAFLMRGLANAEMSRHEKAVADFTKALELDPDAATVYLHRAMAYEKLGRFDLAGKDQKQYERMSGTTRSL